jgi:hypothetical protein
MLLNTCETTGSEDTLNVFTKDWMGVWDLNGKTSMRRKERRWERTKKRQSFMRRNIFDEELDFVKVRVDVWVSNLVLY